nr:HNH endonuclease signature motif containing protein [Halorussus halophilus]
MRQHHTKVHGVPLPNRTCKGCGTDFYDPKARLEYCEDCNPNGGEHNGNWREAKETAECRICASAFEYYPSDKEGVYCPECVGSSPGLLPENPAEKDRVAVECTHCDSELQVTPSRLSGRDRGIFCGLDCYGDWLSENVVGESHHQWEGGEIDYGQQWWRVRREALERDDYTCQNCGKSKSELGRNPDVHHIVRVRDFDKPEQAHVLDNVVSLCRSCHRNVEAGNESVSQSPPKK